MVSLFLFVLDQLCCPTPNENSCDDVLFFLFWTSSAVLHQMKNLVMMLYIYIYIYIFIVFKTIYLMVNLFLFWISSAVLHKMQALVMIEGKCSGLEALCAGVSVQNDTCNKPQSLPAEALSL